MEDNQIKAYIPHCIMMLNEGLVEDPILVRTMQLVFRWANDMGLKGKTVSHLILVPPDPKTPFTSNYKLYCQLECTEEEKKLWEEMRDMQVKKAVNDILNHE